jgi:primosomal replication protein N
VYGGQNDYKREEKRDEAMKEERMENNGVCVIGRIMSGFSYSHEMSGEGFYRTDILVCRASGVMDAVPLMFPEKLADVGRGWPDSMVEVIGQFRSYNKKTDGKSHLELSVFVQGIRFVDEECMDYGSNNRVFLKGFLCKVPVYRRTPLRREIADILLAVNRQYGKSDYIPCICWGKDAALASRLEVGSAVNVMGRIQSREYMKKLSEEETEMRVAYEVSVNRLETEIQSSYTG